MKGPHNWVTSLSFLDIHYKKQSSDQSDRNEHNFAIIVKNIQEWRQLELGIWNILHNNCTVVLLLVICLIIILNFLEWRAGHLVIGFFYKFALQLKISLFTKGNLLFYVFFTFFIYSWNANFWKDPITGWPARLSQKFTTTSKKWPTWAELCNYCSKYSRTPRRKLAVQIWNILHNSCTDVLMLVTCLLSVVNFLGKTGKSLG